MINVLWLSTMLMIELLHYYTVLTLSHTRPGNRLVVYEKYLYNWYTGFAVSILITCKANISDFFDLFSVHLTSRSGWV